MDRLLPIAPIRIKIAPKANLCLSPFEITYGRPFLTTDLLVDSEAHQLLEHLLNLGQAQQVVTDHGNRELPNPEGEPKTQPRFNLGIWFF